MKILHFASIQKVKLLEKGIARNGKIFKGDVIYNGDKIIVGIDGFVAIRNIHERSEVKIFKNSSVKVFSRKNRMNGEKEFEVAILGGRVIVDKNEFNNNKLIINSPSSSVFFEKFSFYH